MAVYQAIYNSLARICDQVSQAAFDFGFSKEEVYEVELAVDEACANIIEHSYGGECEGNIEVNCFYQNEEFRIIIRDYGCSFNPDQVPAPDLVSPVNQRREGGLGLYFMHHGMDDINFKPIDGNGTILTMIKYKKSAKLE
jgi:serine/threonine-protein kinase RsbW